MIRRFLTSATLLATAACAPHIDPPAPMPVPPAAWSAHNDVTQAAVIMNWWTLLDSRELNALVEKALARNAEIRVARANLQAASAMVREARASRRPTGTIDGGVQRSRAAGASLQLDSFGGPAVLPTQTLADVGTSLGWELDLFHRLEGLSDQALAEAGRTLWVRRGVEASVAAGVVRAWADLHFAQRQLALTDQRLPALQDLADRARKAYALGGVRRDEVDVAEARLSALMQTRPTLDAARRNAIRRLGTLTGVAAPDAVAAMNGLRVDRLAWPDHVSAGDPARLLRMRPDVAAAETDLVKAMAQVTVARADLYPRISLTGTLGLTAQPERFDESGALRFGVGPTFSWAIFDMDRVRARIRAAGARAVAAGAAWEAIFLKALEETDVALESFGAARTAAMGAETSARSADALARLADRRRAAGQDSIVSASLARDQALAATMEVERARQATFDAWVICQTALGAGWQDDGRAVTASAGAGPG